MGRLLEDLDSLAGNVAYQHWCVHEKAISILPCYLIGQPSVVRSAAMCTTALLLSPAAERELGRHREFDL